ncbi:disintegrin and metalloproteinase domain-containing protein 19 isoform X2 [Sardina pilchardus]|uniref:disintegrin and metalloproteinase domain-containing protein 19 isoform X2 n=1 Tax=Sardina pilchardus TaxID=27697 RepID=UPI002E0D8E47
MSLSARAAGIWYSACLCVLLCLLYEGDAGKSASNGEVGWRGVQSAPGYEVTYPQWLPAKTHRLPAGEKHPSDVEVWIIAEGQDLLLQLQKNKDLFSPAFRETWYSPEGTHQTSGPNHQDHCFYHGCVVGWGDSSVALSTCSGLRGVVSLNSSVSYIIEPLANQTEPWGHALFRHHHRDQRYAEQLTELIGGMAHPHHGNHGNRERRDISRDMKYVELLLVADHAEFVKRGQDREKVKMILMEAANYVDKYYTAVGVRIAVTGLEVWNSGDQISVSENPFFTLSSFLTWRREHLKRLPNDNAQLITGRSFQGTTIGLAPLNSMCSEYQSGGVNSDHSESVFGVAATLAHELGHNFGMSHDSAGCCQENPDQGGCIMAAATGAPFPRVFNVCNQRELRRFLSAGGGSCLFSPPDPGVRLGGPRCGNGYLEQGEQCDCGEEEECVSSCCNAANCTLTAGAECAHGVCCHNCKLRGPGEACRPAAGSCDLPEFCDGASEACPDNFFLLDGSACAGGGAYCYTGMCLTLQQQCVSLWGPGARVAPEVCFTEVNQAGDQYGNCGKDLQGRYRSCSHRDALCGKIQCVSGAERPVGSNAVSIPTTVISGARRITCKGTHVYHAATEDTLDPGLVMMGTRCGDNGICFSGECRNASFLRADECNAECHGHGVCNNRHHCHCDSGWAPPFCSAPGDGGSVDSGPVTPHGSLLPVVLLLLLSGLVGLAAAGVWWCCKHKPRLLKTPTPPEPPTNQCRSVSKSKSEASGHANPTFQLRNPEAQNTPTATPRPSHAPCPRNAVVRPTTKPPPIPAYAGNTHTIKNLHTGESTHSTHTPHTGESTHSTHTPHAGESTHSTHTSHTGESTHSTHTPHTGESTHSTHTSHTGESTHSTHTPRAGPDSDAAHTPQTHTTAPSPPSHTHTPHNTRPTQTPQPPHTHTHHTQPPHTHTTPAAHTPQTHTTAPSPPSHTHTPHTQPPHTHTTPAAHTHTRPEPPARPPPLCPARANQRRESGLQAKSIQPEKRAGAT